MVTRPSERNDGNGWETFQIYSDTGWLPAPGRAGYIHRSVYRVVNGLATIFFDVEAASNRAAGTIDNLINPIAALASPGNSDARFPMYQTETSAWLPARIFADGRVNVYTVPAMTQGTRFYGTVTLPVG